MCIKERRKKQMTKQQFIKAFKKLSQEDKDKVKQFHEEQLKNAIFIDTFEIAEKCLLWIREAEE
jgi:hypothetical protein